MQTMKVLDEAGDRLEGPLQGVMPDAEVMARIARFRAQYKVHMVL